MTRRLIAALASLWLAACASPAPTLDAPRGTAAALVGVWCNEAEGGGGCWAYDEFRADGRFAACGRTDDDPRPFFGEGRWGVEGRRMCYVVERASANFWLPAGARYCTEIVAIDERTHRYRDLDSGAEFTLRRVPPAERRCPPAAH